MTVNYDIAEFNYHGGPYDRGSADSWYSRPKDPHKYPTGTLNCPKVTDLTPEELEAYHAGYDENEEGDNHKDWG